MSIDRPPHSGPQEEDPELLEQLDEMWDLLEEGEIEEALGLAEDIVAQFETSGTAWLGLAAARYEAGAVRETLEAAERAREVGTENDALRRWYTAAAHHYLWKFDEAREELEALTREDQEFAEAWYLLAQVCEIQGDEVGARRGYDRANAIDPERFLRPVRIDEAAMGDAVQAARDELPEQFREKLDELAVVIRDLPDEDIAHADSPNDPIPPDVLGLYVGTNLLGKSVFSPSDAPGVIFIFQRNLERICPDTETLIAEIRTTLWHELAHYLGFEEDQMHELGLE